jgi:hypothetical protein
MLAPENTGRVRHQVLCKTLSGNHCDLLTITDFERTEYAISDEGLPIGQRRYVFLSARVHPGESNSSWAMKGNPSLRVDADYYCRPDCVFGEQQPDCSVFAVALHI